jgi:hypothetical protein
MTAPVSRARYKDDGGDDEDSPSAQLLFPAPNPSVTTPTHVIQVSADEDDQIDSNSTNAQHPLISSVFKSDDQLPKETSSLWSTCMSSKQRIVLSLGLVVILAFLIIQTWELSSLIDLKPTSSSLDESTSASDSTSHKFWTLLNAAKGLPTVAKPIVSLTTTAERLHKELPITLKSILQQEEEIDALHIYMPLGHEKALHDLDGNNNQPSSPPSTTSPPTNDHKPQQHDHHRRGSLYSHTDPESQHKELHRLLQHPKIKLSFVKDVGPATKLLPIVHHLLSIGRIDQPILVSDDDHYYAPNWASNIYQQHLKTPDKMLGLRGWRVNKDFKWGVNAKEYDWHVLVGWNLWHRYRVGVVTANSGYMVTPRMFVPNEQIEKFEGGLEHLLERWSGELDTISKGQDDQRHDGHASTERRSDEENEKIREDIFNSIDIQLQNLTSTTLLQPLPPLLVQASSENPEIPESSFFVDDIWINGHAARQGVERWIVPTSEANLDVSVYKTLENVMKETGGNLNFNMAMGGGSASRVKKDRKVMNDETLAYFKDDFSKVPGERFYVSHMKDIDGQVEYADEGKEVYDDPPWVWMSKVVRWYREEVVAKGRLFALA